jgi:ketosteroid isomerase-like protein
MAMPEQDGAEIIRRFIDCINQHHVEGIAALMSDDHVFVDALGTMTHGRDALRWGWGEYYRMFPDYQIEIHEITSTGNVVGVFGLARGTYVPDGVIRTENQWKISAAWMGVVRNGLVSEWRVYCNIETVLKIVEKESSRKNASVQN